MIKLNFARRAETALTENGTPVAGFEIKFRIDDINTVARFVPLVSPSGVTIFDDESIALLDKYSADCARFADFGEVFDADQHVKYYTLRVQGKVTPLDMTVKDIDGKAARFYSNFNIGSALTIRPWRKVIEACELNI